MNYEQINLQAGMYSPSPVKNRNNKSFDYFVRSLFQRATTVFEWELPKEWDGKTKDFFLYCLFRFGYIVISDFEQFGLGFQPCGLSGYNFYYQPAKALVANPALKQSLELELGKDGQLLKLTPDYRGIWDILEFYAEKLSLLDNAINMSLINNKYAFFLGARNKTAGMALKKMLDLVNKGEPAVVWDMKLLNDPTDKEMPFQEWKRDHLKDSYLTTDQLLDFHTILNDFDAEVGIPTVPYQKKERMVTDEANAKLADGKARSVTWFETIQSSINEIKQLYPDITLSCSMRYDTEGEPGQEMEVNENE
jgi:hypothetical protein